MGWYEDAIEKPVMAGVMVVMGFMAGVSGFQGVMTLTGQERVAAGTYILRADLPNQYAPRAAYSALEAERDASKLDLKRTEGELDQLKTQIAQIDLKRQARALLDEMKTKVVQDLKNRQLELALCSSMLVEPDSLPNDRSQSVNDPYCTVQQRDIRSLEEELRGIDRKMLDQI